MADSPKSRRVILELKQKLEIIKYHEKNPKRSQQEISNYFTELWKIDVKRRTVGDILQTSGKRAREADDVSSTPRKRHRSAHHENMEDALYMWFSNARAKNIPVTDDILKLKAKKFGDDLGVHDFKYSNGWLNRFKTDMELSGESAGIHPDLIFDGRVKAREAMSNYDLKNIFNIDETGLFYRILPDRSLTTADATKGVKKYKDRITIALHTVDDYDLTVSLSQVQDSLDLHPDMRLTVREFLNLDKNAEFSQSLTDDEISSTVENSNDNTDQVEDDSEEESPRVPTYAEARQGLECLLRHLESKESTTESEINFLLRLAIKIKPSKQSTIDMFFKKQ
ncbi:tigger transposable element-derived protein 4-like [Saccostrea echinata]|uniref:tigger transposable element-derived protein 4-like n=1 Tax=Saccostrea echinata TaxID=191078 RepID=UPI002A822F94|nr:tigger transposable element-derived protein 4-like [Saccostrea echinata]